MLDTQSGHHFMCGVRRIRSARILDCLRGYCNGHFRKNDTLLGLVTTCRDFILFEWDLKPYDRKISLYKRVLFVLRVSHYVWSVCNELRFTCTFLGRYLQICFVCTRILSGNDT